jgi:hypothetical protein
MDWLTSFSETIDTEVKGWLNPKDPADAAKIARACIALRNSNGGKLILGFDNKTLQKSVLGIPSDIHETYHADVIQQIVSKFSLPKFDVEVKFAEKDGQTHPLIFVKGGVEYPVITKSSYDKVLRQNTVYLRTLSNDTVSSSEPNTPDDWDRLIRICFDNREANIGRFFRRHIQAIATELKQLPTAPAVEEFLKEGKAQFDARVKEKVAEGKIPSIPINGLREVSLIINGDFEPTPVKHLLDKLFLLQPRYTGWPPWINTHFFSNAEARPYVKKGAWEALVINVHPFDKNMIDFWRIEPAGRFYCLRTFDDDTSNTLLSSGGKPGQLFDFKLLISRTAEILGTGKVFAEALGANPKNTKLEFAFRLSGLKGRTICCWVEPGRRLIQHVKAEDSEVTSKCSIPLEIPQSALWQSVKVLTQPVFDIFGSGVGDSIIEEITNETLNRSF